MDVTVQGIGKILKKFQETGSVKDIEAPPHHRFAFHLCVSECIAKYLNVPTCRRSQELRLSSGTLCRILHMDLHLH